MAAEYEGHNSLREGLVGLNDFAKADAQTGLSEKKGKHSEGFSAIAFRSASRVFSISCSITSGNPAESVGARIQRYVDSRCAVSIGDETIALVREQAFDVVLLDIAMPDKNGVDTLRVIKQIRPQQGVLMLSGFPESQYAINLLKAGANGYLNKDAAPDEIVRAIRTVARGHRYL